MVGDNEAKSKKKIGDHKKSFKLVTQRPVAVLMVALAIIVFGYVSYSQLSLNLMPDITYPTLTVRTEYEGAAPEEVENLISRPLEQILAVVRNKTGLSSISRAGQSDVILEFTWDTDMNAATQDVRELLEQFHPPEEAEKPLVLRYDPTLDPIMRFGLFSTRDTSEQILYTIREIADEEIKRDLEAIPGVAAVKVKGGLEEEIVVALDEKLITSLGLDINQINSRLAAENINLAGGNLEEGDTEYMVRTLNLFINIDEIANLIVDRIEGAEIRLKDIGKVYKSHREREVITRVNGRESVELEIYKEAGANIVQLAQSVKDRVFGTPEQQAAYEEMQQAQKEKEVSKEKEEEEKKTEEEMRGRGRIEKPNYVKATLPEDVDIALLSDQSTFIEQSIAEVKNTAVLGGILAVAVLFFFLRSGYSTFIIALSIPLSIVATFAPMNMFSVTLNMMSLGGLALGIGMLVDNSIVVLESIFRCREEGDPVVESAVRGASEVGGAVTASTLTTIAVFLPIVFVEGVAGQLFGDLSLTVVFSLLMSLIVALFFIPMLASRDFKAMAKKEKMKSSLLNSWMAKLLRLETRDNAKKGRKKKAEQKDSFTPDSFKDSIVKLGVNAVAIVGSLIETLFKVLLLFVGFLLLTIKLIFIVLFSPIHLLLTYVYVFFRPKAIEKSWTMNYAHENHPIKVLYSFVNHVWDNLLEFKAYSSFSNSVYQFTEKTISGWRKVSDYIKKGNLYRITGIFGYSLLVIGYIALFMFFTIRLLLNILVQFFLKTVLLFILFVIILTTQFINIFTYILRGLFAPFLLIFDRSFTWLRNVYPNLLRSALNHKVGVVGTAAVLLFITIFYMVPRLGTELLPEMHQGEFNVELRMPVGTPLDRTDERIAPLDEFISSLGDVGMHATVVGAEKETISSSEEGEHTAKITIRLKSSENLIQKEEALIELIRDEARELPQVETNISRPTLFSFKTPIEVEIKGYNLAALKELSRKVVTEMEEIDGLYDVRSNIQPGNPEIQIIYDRDKLAKYNLNIARVAQTVRNKVLGYVPTKFNKEDKRIEIRVRVQETDRNTLEEIRQLNISPSLDVPIPLESVADIKLAEGPAEIRRIEQQRAALITANVSGLDLGSAATSILKTLSSIEIPPDFNIDMSGQNKEMQVSMQSLTMAMLLAIFLVYTVMAMLFESIVQPLIIILSVPLALIGVIFVLWIGNIPISVIVGIGVIVLVGIVVNNAIVLIDYINTLRGRGLKLIDAVVEGGSVRLRPILMTTTTTVLALLPMALGLGEGAEIRIPMAWTIIAGLLSATILTLVIIPVVYTIVSEVFEKRIKKIKGNA